MSLHWINIVNNPINLTLEDIYIRVAPSSKSSNTNMPEEQADGKDLSNSEDPSSMGSSQGLSSGMTKIWTERAVIEF